MKQIKLLLVGVLGLSILGITGCNSKGDLELKKDSFMKWVIKVILFNLHVL